MESINERIGSVGDNGFECVVHVMRDMMSDSTIYRCLFSLNGRKMDVKVSVQRHRDDPKAAITKLCGAVAEEIMARILTEAFANNRFPII